MKKSSYLRKHRVMSMITIIVLLLTAFSIGVLLIQNTFIYYPSHSESAETELLGSKDYAKMTISTDEGKTYSGWAKMNESNEYTLLYFGGNAESSASFFVHQSAKEWAHLKAYNIIMIDYPGFGLSSGKPTESSIYEMALEVFDYVYELEMVDNSKIVVMGFSLGTGVATYLAEYRDFYKLILVAPYTSMVDVVNTQLPVFYGPLRWLLRNEYDSLQRAPFIKMDTLIIFSLIDDVIPSKQSQEWVDAIAHSTYHIEEYLRHNDLLNHEDVLEQISEFIK